jgi:hypothetical protein
LTARGYYYYIELEVLYLLLVYTSSCAYATLLTASIEGVAVLISTKGVVSIGVVKVPFKATVSL